MGARRCPPLLCGLVLMFGGITFGYQMGIASPLIQAWKDDFGPTAIPNSTVTWFQAIPSGVAIAAPVVSRTLLSFLTRRMATWVICSTGAAFVLLMLFVDVNTLWLGVLARALLGLTIGAVSVTNPMYIVELAPDGQKDGYGVINQIGVSVGVLMPYLVGLVSWHWNIIVPAICAGIPALASWVLDESPADEEAEGAMPVGEAFGQLCCTKKFGPLVVLCLLAVFQQLSGINCILSNLSFLFEGTSLSPNIASAIATGGQLVATVVAAPLTNWVGPRVSWVISLAGCAVADMFYGLSVQFKWSKTSGIAFVFIYMLAFGLGCGPLPWFYGSTVFDADIRPTANAIASSINWGSSFAMIFLVPTMQQAWGGDQGMFYLFTGACAVACVVGVFFIRGREENAEGYAGK